MGMIFGSAPKDDDEVYETLIGLEGIVDEMMFREDYLQTYYPAYKNMTWGELCDEAIKLFQSLKGERE